jgi:hypothetical protein
VANRRTPTDSDIPRDFAEVPPRDLHATSDIRFVMRETATLRERVDGLTKAIDNLGPSFEKALEKHAADMKERATDLKVDLKATDAKVSDIEKAVSFVKGALWVLGGLFAVAVVLLGVIARALIE